METTFPNLRTVCGMVFTIQFVPARYLSCARAPWIHGKLPGHEITTLAGGSTVTVVF